MAENNYTDSDIITLEWKKHIRVRPGMYIGRVGDGTNPSDGIYVLLKEIIDNSADEFAAGYGRLIDISITEDGTVSVRDYGRGIPLNSVDIVVSTLNTGGKFEGGAFRKSVGLNGVGSKAANALSSRFYIESFRDGRSAYAEFSAGNLLDKGFRDTTQKNGTLVVFTPDREIFGNYSFNMEFVESMLRNYSYLRKGLTLRLNGKDFTSRNGLLDLLNDTAGDGQLYPPIHLVGQDIEIAFTHGTSYGENIASFVNGQNTRDGGTHLAAFREAITKTIREFFKKDFDPNDIRQGIIGAISIGIDEPNFESQTKIKLGSTEMSKGGPTIRNYVNSFVKTNLDNYLHIHKDVADIILKKIQEAEKERKEMSGIQKKAKERAKKAAVHNKKLYDCRHHFGENNEYGKTSSIFITEGDSASGTITKIRNANNQAVFSLKGKPLNCYKASKKVIYENEEFNLLVAALGIEEDTENLRYNNVIIATDADDDGMHIRLLLVTFFLKFFPDVIRRGHVYILQTPLFRVKNKKETRYCYSIEEKDAVAAKMKNGAEVTRFKGLGEISDTEFRLFIGDDIRLDKVNISDEDSIQELMEFYMGDNTLERQEFIKSNLRSEAELEDVM